MVQRIFPIISPVVFFLVVAVLGFVTPGYNHYNYTISRLAIERYGWIQSVNFLQLALGLYLTGIRFARVVSKKGSGRTVNTIFTVCALFLVVAAFFPTDPIENVPLDFSLLSPTGLVHITVVAIFLLLSPLGIISLASILYRDPRFRSYAYATLTAGFLAFSGSIIWFVLYFLGIYLEYRGIFQKTIALPILLWLVLINLAIIRTKK